MGGNNLRPSFLVLGLFFVATTDAADDPEDGDENDEDDDEEEPDRAEKDEFLDSRDFVEDFDGLADAENAKLRSAFPRGGVEAFGFGEDDVFVGFFFVGVDFFVAKERENLEGVGGAGVDVAGVLDERGGGDWGGEDEAGDFVLEDFGGSGDFAVDVAEDEVTEATHGFDTAIRFVIAVAHSNHNRAKLGATMSSFRNSKRVSYLGFVAGSNCASFDVDR